MSQDEEYQTEPTEEPEGEGPDQASRSWYEDYSDEVIDQYIDEYDIISTPNDFNVLTILSFMESGAIKVPGFQRNYIWDIRRASKLIESLILGLPVPQLFLYEEQRNSFLVIDGQQRLMSMYYFMKQRFPRKEKRTELRQIFDREGRIPESVISSDEYFMDFKLRLGSEVPNTPRNRFHGKRYHGLGEYKTAFDLRPIRNIIVKQLSPDESEEDGYDSAVFEIFHRLNTGGVNLKAQEIRSSLYHSNFYDMLYRLNADGRWRRFLSERPELHMKDIEIILRAFSMLIFGSEYRSSMLKFLNVFSKKSQRFDSDKVSYFEELFNSFLDCSSDLPADTYISRQSKRFNIALFEAVFVGACHEALESHRQCARKIPYEEVATLMKDATFVKSSASGTTNKDNIDSRLSIAKSIITPC